MRRFLLGLMMFSSLLQSPPVLSDDSVNGGLWAYIDASERGKVDHLDEKKLLSYLGDQSEYSVFGTFDQLFAKYPENPWLHEAYGLWTEKFVFDPIKNREAFKTYFDFVSKPNHLPDNGLMANGIEKLYQNREELEGASRFKKAKSWVSGRGVKKHDELLDYFEANYKKLQPRERVYMLTAMKDPKNRGRMFNYLYNWRYQPAGFHFDHSAFALTGKYSLSPYAKDEFSVAFRDFLATEGMNQPIGPSVFAKLLDENPKLAKKLSPYFYHAELFPGFFGDKSFLKEPSSYLEHESGSQKVKSSIDRILKHIVDSGDLQTQKEIRSILLNADLGTSRVFNYYDRFERFLPFIDLKTLEGSRFVFNYGPFKEIHRHPVYREAVKRYLSHLATSPEEMVKVFKMKDKYLHYFGGNDGALAKIFENDPKGLAKFAKTYLSTSGEIFEAVKTHNLPQWDVAAGYKNVLKDYVAFGNPSDAEFKWGRDQLEKILVRGNHNSESYDRSVKALGTDFDEWYRNPTKVDVEVVDEKAANLKKHANGLHPTCDLNSILKTIAIRN